MIKQKLKKYFSNFTIMLFGVLFTVGGIGIAFASFNVMVTRSNGDKWITAPASITYNYSAQPKGGRYSASFGINYFYRASYSFVASNGKTYSTEKAGSSQPVSEDMLSHPTIVQGDIFYDPNNPNASDLSRPIFDPVTPSVIAFFALIFSVLGLELLYDDLKQLHLIPKHSKGDFHNPPTQSRH